MNRPYMNSLGMLIRGRLYKSRLRLFPLIESATVDVQGIEAG